MKITVTGLKREATTNADGEVRFSNSLFRTTR